MYTVLYTVFFGDVDKNALLCGTNNKRFAYESFDLFPLFGVMCHLSENLYPHGTDVGRRVKQGVLRAIFFVHFETKLYFCTDLINQTQ